VSDRAVDSLLRARQTGEMLEDFFTVAGRQRSCRDYSGETVPEADLVQMIECATHAPSAHNSQPWEFVVVQDSSARSRISRIARLTWDSTRHYVELNLDSSLFRDVDQFINDRDFGGAPVLVILGVDLGKVNEVVAGCSIYPAAQNLMLAAGALGYSSAFTNFTVNGAEALASEVGFPTSIKPYGIVSIGRPAKLLGPPRRQSAQSKMHRDRFGEPWTAD
jgi:nitroreductase